MCGRITQKSSPDQLRLTIRMGTLDDSRVTKSKARYNGAPVAGARNRLDLQLKDLLSAVVT
jgi:hypothetical protein